MAAVRPLRAVPAGVWVLLAAALAAQLAWHQLRPGPTARAEALPAPPPVEGLRALSLGEPVAAARLGLLWLQAHDYQPGVSVPFRELDYARVAAWLGRILDLDPRGQGPMLAAARIYGEVSDPERQRRMLDFVHQRFLEAPNRRWRWLAHSAILAKHRLDDLDLALRYARSITEHTEPDRVPGWARHMTVVLLEDRGELEAARILLGGLLESGEITDPQELYFLERKLRELESEADEISTDR
jgi:hypothetical protein